METPSYDDAVSDYGYNLTAEEEESLWETIIKASSNQVPTLANQPGQHATAEVPKYNYAIDVCELDPASARGPWPGGGTAAKTEPRSIPTPPPGHDAGYKDVPNALVETPILPTAEAQEPSDSDIFRETLSPLARFRTFPRKPFSVSDFTGGAWCELQYYYVLSRLRGRKVRNEAMKAGTKIHEKLEEEVHTTVKIDVTTKEDKFGLRLWNIIQGLRTLRDTGLTRELEVWGMVNGNIVNGIIDGLSYKNPNPESEEKNQGSQTHQSSQQAQITNFFPSNTPKTKPIPQRKIYIMDVKTRASKSPPKGAQVRGTKIQLFLYHRFLSDMASDRLDYKRVFRRYGLDTDEPFSDVFMAQIGAIHDEIFLDDEDISDNATGFGYDPGASQPETVLRDGSFTPPPDQIRYNNIQTLLQLLRDEIQLTFPEGAASIGPVVAVEYRARASGEEEDGAIIGEHVFPVDQNDLDDYLAKCMEWWNGEREARGVPIEETFKCRTCDFIDDCEWRMEQESDMLKKARKNQEKARKKADMETW